MKKFTVLSLSLCLAVAGSVSSCKKAVTNVVTPTTPTPPTTPTTTAPSTPTPNVGSVNGVLVSLMIESTTVTSGFPVTISMESAVASFFTAAGSSTLVDGGAVSVNSIALEKQTNNSYTKMAMAGLTPSDLDFNTGSSNWNVGGAGSVPAFSYNHTSSFPDYTGSLPDSIVRGSGLTISLSGKVSNADSVILVIAAGSTSIVRTVAGSASSVSVSSGDLAGLPVITNKSAIVEIVPYRVSTSTFSGKTYAFIKEFAATKSINIQ